MDKTDILLTIGVGSVAGILIVNHFVGSRAYAAADDKKAADAAKKKMMDDMKMMADAKKVADKAVKVMAPICQCPDGTMVQSIATGQKDNFICPCMMLTGQLGQPAFGQGLGQGVTVIPQAAGVRQQPLQTVPNLMLMPGQTGGLLAGGTALPAFAYEGAAGEPGMPGMGGMGGMGGGAMGGMGGMGGQPGAPGAPGIAGMDGDIVDAFAADDMVDMGFGAADDVAMAIKDAGIGMAEQKKLTDALKKQDMMKKVMDAAKVKQQKAQTCTCPDKTKVAATGGVCNCAAVQAAGAIGLGRQVVMAPQGVGLGQLTGLQGKVPKQMRMPRMMQAIPMGGVSPTNTGQVCVLDPNTQTFKLSGTQTMCDPGPGITMTRDPGLAVVGESPQTMLSEADKSGASLTALYGMAYLGDSFTHGMGKALPLIPSDDEDLWDDFGDLRKSYPYSHVQDGISPYDEDSNVTPFFITEPESFRAISLLPANYPRR